MICRACAFETDRLVVKEWHSLAKEDWVQQELATVVGALLTPSVTRTLPAGWQGSYTQERAREWVRERDAEGTTLIALDRRSRNPVGLVILFETAAESGAEVRLGYLLADSVWGKGFASELVAGFVAWCRACPAIASLASGVEHDHLASRRVLEKSGFQQVPSAGEEDMFRLHFSR